MALNKIMTFSIIIIIHVNIDSQTIWHVFSPGEKLGYEIDYTLGIIRIPAGEVSFTVSTRSYNHEQAYYFESIGKNYSSIDWFYKVYNQLQSYSKTGDLKPLWFERNMNINGSESNEIYTIDQPHNRIFSINKKSGSPLKRDTINYSSVFYDILTAGYYLRNIDFTNFKPNDSISIRVILDNKFHPIVIKFLGKESLSLPLHNNNNNNYNCLKFSIKVIPGEVFHENEKVIAWVTDDENHVPVQFETKIILGSVKIYLINAENTKKPIAFIK